MSRTPLETARNVELHELLADWGEGTSHAPGEEGDGAPATVNDATWRHRFFDTVFWTTEGGDFSATVSASQSVGSLGQYTWSSAQMIADVQSWLDNPGSNFGWLVLGDESTSVTTKRFDTRESASPPLLTIQYTPGSKSDPDSAATSLSTGAPAVSYQDGWHQSSNMRQNALFALVVGAAVAAIGISLTDAPKATATPNAALHSCGFLASPGFSACEYERERLDRHQRRMRADPGWAMHEHVDLWRDIPGSNNS